MEIKPAIVVVAYNRPAPLWRLLQSLAGAFYPFSDIDLIISIDKSDSEETHKVSESFEWAYGNKKIITQNQHLGLKEHILSCGDFTNDYEAVILLEDDLLVSPWFYYFAKDALQFYQSEVKIAGISLYNYQVAESCFYPFKAIDDGTDVYFMQVASSWGQAWSKEQWQKFRKWFVQNPELTHSKVIPDYLYQWGKNSWKKHFIHYLIETESYFVFPRLSLSTNFEEPGTNASTKGVFQVALQTSFHEFLFCNFEKSLSVYDAWFEIKPFCLRQLNPILKSYDFGMDLYGAKTTEHFDRPYVLTSKQANNEVLSFSYLLFPLETNIILKQLGAGTRMYPVASNNFVKQKLPQKNLLDDKEKESGIGISLIVPVETLNAEALKLTVESFAQQTHSKKELLIVVSSSHYSEAERVCSYIEGRIKIIKVEEAAQGTLSLIKEGFKNCSMEVVSWLTQGTIIYEKAFNYVIKVFENNGTVHWIKGINEDYISDEQYSKVRTLNYRLVASEAYKRLEEDNLNSSTELHFFRNACFNFVMEKEEINNLHELFIELIKKFQLTVTVIKFGQLNQQTKHIIGLFERAELLAKYKDLRVSAKTSSKVVQWLLKTPLFNDGAWQWYHTSLNNYPDVLRYDRQNDTFYFAKY